MVDPAGDTLDLPDLKTLTPALSPELASAAEAALLESREHFADKLTVSRWCELVAGLADRSPKVAAAFIEATPTALELIGTDSLAEWAAQGRRLTSGGWSSAGLAVLYFANTGALLSLVPLPAMAHLVAVAGHLSARSPEIAATCLRDAPATLARLDDRDREPFLVLLGAVTGASWAETDQCLERTPGLLDPISADLRTDLLGLARAVAEELGPGGFALFSEAAAALAEPGVDQAELVHDARRLAVSSPTVAMELLKSAPTVLQRLTPEQTRQWCDIGIGMLDDSGDTERGASWFRLESAQSQEMVADLAGRVELVDVCGLLGLYAQALCGEDLLVQPRRVLARRGVGWGNGQTSTTDGISIFLPPAIDTFADHEANFAAYKVHATHQAARLEFGSFSFEPGLDGGHLPATTSPGHQSAPPMFDFYDLFEDRTLISELFSLAEGSRIDTRVALEYPGIEPALRRLQDHEAGHRPAVAPMPRRQAFVENLLRASLGRPDLIGGREDDADAMSSALEALSILDNADATVQDTAEVAAMLYDLASAVPNLAPPPLSDPTGEQATAGGEVPFSAPPSPEFRGDYRPELVQLTAALHEQDRDDPTDESLTREQILDLLAESAGIAIGDDDADGPSLETIVDNLIDEATQAPGDDACGTADADADDQRPGTDGIEWFRYDEWDFLAHDYRPDRCRLGERRATEGDIELYDDTLRRHHGLVLETRRQFEQMRPEAFRRIKRLEDGPEIDLDEAISFHVDKKAGAGPLARLYTRRNKIVRDVAIALLLDLSGSTSEEVGRPMGMGNRIIDIERESTVLMIEALEAIGDAYGIYGFSGKGADNVEVHVVKELDEPLDDDARRRVGGIEPLAGTRMGPAIRHIVAKLDECGAKVKILILVSDGRPQDEDYGPDGAAMEYAVHDTKHALLEARRHHIEPFLITVDDEGHDYLGQICGDIGYEVVADIESLPRRLPRLYRHLASQ